MNYFDPELRPVFGVDGDITIPTPSSEGEVGDSIGPGLYKFTLPDGQQVIVDQYGNIIG